MFSQPEKTIELTVPARSSMMLVVRMTTAGVMSRAGLTLDALDDVKMAVEEACSCLMMQAESCQSVRVAFAPTANAVAVRLEALGCVGASGEKADACTNAVIRCILESMMDDVTLKEEHGGIRAIQMLKRLPRAQASHG